MPSWRGSGRWLLGSADPGREGPRRRARVLGTLVLAAAAAGAALAAFAPATGLAADPSPTPHAPSCAERYPADGPAGIDLQLGCVVRELVAAYTGERVDPSRPARVTEWLVPIGAALTLAGVALVLVRLARRRLGERLAPVTPEAWWQCPECRSVNAAGAARCYRCHATWTPEAGVLPTAEHPVMTQRFGGDRKKGGDRPGRSEDDAPL